MTQFPHGSDPLSPPPLPPEALVGQSPNFPSNPPHPHPYGPSFQPPVEPGPFSFPQRYRTPIWLWVLTLGLLGVLIVMQRPEEERPAEIAKRAAGLGEIKPPDASPFVLIAKLTFAMRDLLNAAAASGGAPPISPTGESPIVSFVSMSDGIAGWSGSDPFHSASAHNPPKPNKHPEAATDRLHAAIVAAEFLDKDELNWRLADIEKDLDKKSPLNDDVHVVRAVYGLDARPLPRSSRGGAGGSATAEGAVRPPDASSPADSPEQDADMAAASTTPNPKPIQPHTPTKDELAASHAAIIALDTADIDGFRKRHGWFANLVLSRGETSASAPDPRAEAASQGFLMLVLMGILGVGLFVVGITGLVLLAIALTRLFSGTLKWRMVRPVPAREWPEPTDGSTPTQSTAFHVAPRQVLLATPGSVWLETVAVFFAMFLGVKLLGMLAEHLGASRPTLILGSLWAQWLVLLSIFWPMVRGMPFSRWRDEIGWKSNRGVFREIGAGITGYLAGLPVYFGMAILVVAITFIIGHFTGAEPHPGGNRLTDVLESGSPWELLLVFCLATVWAPVVEESIFRGCLFRHLRRRTGLILAGLGSAAVFAVLHGYIIQGLFMVGTLGFWFALMREWRGNIIATATAHALHNGVVMTIMLIALAFARG